MGALLICIQHRVPLFECPDGCVVVADFVAVNTARLVRQGISREEWAETDNRG